MDVHEIDELREMILQLDARLTALQSDATIMNKTLQQLRHERSNSSYDHPPNIPAHHVNDPSQWPCSVLRSDVHRAHLVKRIIEPARDALRTSIFRHAVPQDHAKITAIAESLDDNMAYYASVKSKLSQDIGVPPALTQHLLDVQYVTLRHKEGKEVADYFLRCLHPLLCCPEHRDALNEALAYARQKSLLPESGNVDGRGPEESGSNRNPPPGIRG